MAMIVISCNNDNIIETSITSRPPNILLIIADDMGKDGTSGYSEGRIKPNTPNLNTIKNKGLFFNNLWINPACSPTRPSIITRKHGYRCYKPA